MRYARYMGTPAGADSQKQQNKSEQNEEKSRIPMPDEEETVPAKYERGIGLPSLSSLFKNIKTEDLILIALIILLISEGFDDDLLIIALLYILIF